MIQTFDVRIIVQDFLPLNLSSTNVEDILLPFINFPCFEDLKLFKK